MKDERRQRAWDAALARAEVRCVVRHRGTVVADFRPTRPEALWVPITVAALGETARGSFWHAWRDFMASGRRTGTCDCEAVRVIEKFGQALQLAEPFTVEFERQPARPWWLRWRKEER